MKERNACPDVLNDELPPPADEKIVSTPTVVAFGSAAEAETQQQSNAAMLKITHKSFLMFFIRWLTSKQKI